MVVTAGRPYERVFCPLQSYSPAPPRCTKPPALLLSWCPAGLLPWRGCFSRWQEVRRTWSSHHAELEQTKRKGAGA